MTTATTPPRKASTVTFFSAIGSGFRKYADFTGTASRPEFWWWTLFTTLASTALAAASNAAAGGGIDVTALWSIVVLLPSLAVGVRRLRDADHGWGHVFWLLLPVAGVIVIVVLCAQPSHRRVDTQPDAQSMAVHA